MITEDILLVTASAVPIALVLFLYQATANRLGSIDNAAFRMQMAYMYFYFLAAPILHIGLDVFLDAKVSDKASAFMLLNFINSIGLSISILGLAFIKPPSQQKFITQAPINWRRLRAISLLFIILGTITYAISWMVYGMAMVLAPIDGEKFAIPIYPFILIECVPMLVGWYYISGISLKQKQHHKRYFWAGLLLVGATAIIYSGLRGSRVTIVFQILSFIMFYSIAIRKIGTKDILIMILASVIFNNIYSVFKYGGADAIEIWLTTGEKPQYVEKYSDPARIILQDLGRSDVQAAVFDRLNNDQYAPPYFPHTFLYGLQLLLPAPLRLDSLSSKVDLGTIALYNITREKSGFSASQIYGITAETALNFGYWLLPLAFFSFGALHRASLIKARISRQKSSILLYPLFVLTPIYFLFYDFDNIVFLLIKTWLIPFSIYILCKLRTKSKPLEKAQ